LEEQFQYIFRKPLWRKMLPIFLLGLVWLIPVGYIVAATSESTALVFSVIRSTEHFLRQRGMTFDRVLWAAGIASIPVLLWLYWGFEKLVITPDGIVRRLPFGAKRSLRWGDVDEVLIEHIDVIFEGKQTAKKILRFYATRHPFVPWRRYMRITNSEFDCYHHAERIAAQVSIPAIAARKREEIRHKGKAARFAIREMGDSLLALVFVFAAFALVPVWGLDRLWTADLVRFRHYTLLLAALLLIAAFRKFFFRQLGIDEKNLYVMRRDWIVKTIPLDSIVDVRVLDNRMRVFAKQRRKKKPVQVFKTNRFIRNRGVLLRLIREQREERDRLDATPIKPLKAVKLSQQSDAVTATAAASPAGGEDTIQA
jgi:hypothetical protein